MLSDWFKNRCNLIAEIKSLRLKNNDLEFNLDTAIRVIQKCKENENSLKELIKLLQYPATKYLGGIDDAK